MTPGFAYQAIMPQYTTDTAELALLPLAMRMAGPRGSGVACHHPARTTAARTSSWVATTPDRVRTRAAPRSSGRHEAQELLAAHEKELGVAMVDFKNMVYLPDSDTLRPG